jgi:hypothetical protein
MDAMVNLRRIVENEPKVLHDPELQPSDPPQSSPDGAATQPKEM